MDEIISFLLVWHKDHQDLINLIKDTVFFAGAYAFFHGAYFFMKYLREKKYQSISSSIRENLECRERLEPLLDKFIVETAKNTKDVALRFVHWKNYPWKLNDDAYKHYPWVKYFSDTTVQQTWLDSTGINIQHPLWYLSTNLYIDKNGIFFTSYKDIKNVNFKKFEETTLILHLPFENIVNYDFKEVIEYEPVLYIRYPYHQRKKLYDDHIVVRNKDGEGYLNIDLSQKNWMRKYSWPKYQWFKFKLCLRTLLSP
jgi:hypothetical protein